MPRKQEVTLSRRERQIMDIVYRLKRATAAEIYAEIPDPPSLSSIRTLLRILESKGHLRHEQDGPRYLFLPTVPRERARVGALRQLVQIFFDGSTADTVAALLQESGRGMSKTDLDRISKMIDAARKEGR